MMDMLAQRARTISLRLLAVPLFYKLLIANCAIVLLGALAGTGLTLRVSEAHPGPIVGAQLTTGFALAGLLLSVSLNALILRAALLPLRELRIVAGRVSHGDLTVRARSSPLADADLAQLAHALNLMLDRMQRYRERIEALASAIITAQEAERQRIARELHDDTGQSLAFLLVRIKMLSAVEMQPEVRAGLDELREQVVQSIERVRRLALDLRPPALDHLGFVPAVRALVQSFSDRLGVPVDFSASGTLALSDERAIAAYRIVQEALTNVAKHAHPAHVWVTVAHHDGVLRLTVRDDGCGFMPESPERSSVLANGDQIRREDAGHKGLGLFGMEERTRLLGGHLTVRSSPGAGTTIIAELPQHAPQSVAHDQPADAGMIDTYA